MYKKCILIVICLLAIPFVHSQEKNDAGSDSLYIYSSLFSKYLQAEDTEKAIYYGEKFKDAYDKRGLEKYSTYWSIVENLVLLQLSIGNICEALDLMNESLLSKKNDYEDNGLDYATSLSDQAGYNFEFGYYEGAIRLEKEALEIRKNILGPEHLDYASSLSDLANYYYYLGDYPEALRLGTEALKIRKKVLGVDNPDYANSLCNLSLFYSGQGDNTKALQLGIEALEIQKNVLGPEHPAYARTLNNLSMYNAILGNYSEAIRLGSRAMEILKKELGKDHPDYVASLNNLANYNSHLCNYTEAIRLGNEAMEIRKINLGPEHPDYARTLYQIALFHSGLGNYPEAIRLGTKAMEIQKSVLGPEHPDYASSLSALAGYNYSLGNFTESIRLGTEALEIRKKVLGPEHPDYASSLGNLALYHLDLGDYPEAIRLGTEALKIRKDVLGTEHPDYAISLRDLANCKSCLGDYPEAIRLGTKAMEIQKSVLGPEHPDYAMTLSNIASYHFSIGNVPEAIRLEMEAIEIRRKVLGPEHPDYALSLSNLASENFSLGNYSEAIRLGTEALEIRKKVLGPEHPAFARTLNNLAFFYSSLGNYKEAIRLTLDAQRIQRSVLGPEHPNYASSLSNLAGYFYSIGLNSEAIRFETEACEIRRKVLGSEHPNYASSLINLATYNSHFGNIPEAIRLSSDALEIQKKVLGPDNPHYAANLNNLANYYCDLGNYTEAIRLGTKAMEIQKKVLGSEHPDYALSLVNLAHCYYAQGNHSESYNYSVQSLRSCHDFILRNFSELSSSLQKSLWSQSNSYRFNTFFPSMVFRYQTSETISKLYDMTALFAKGILLNSGIEMRRLILESGAPDLVTRYDALVSNRSIYDKQLEKPKGERVVNLDSLRSVMERQEMELARDSKAYGDFSRNLRITWQDVQGKLDEDDIAVEFLDFPLYGTDSTMYVALILKKDYDSPRMIPLFEKGQLDSVPEGSLYTDTDLYSLVWKPLESELSGVKDIYFSPSGELHRIGVEYLPVSATENICDIYALHRLSSTRQLALIQNDTEGEAGVLYGDLDYDKATAMGRNSASTGSRKRIYQKAPRAIVDSLDLRGTLSRLPYTKKETEKIARDMKRSNVPCILYTDKDGTEESFKLLDGTRPRILHIATHGFYLTKQEAVESNFARPMLQGAEHEYREDKPMTRSGLLLSGCRPALNHDTIPEGVEDGILTAQEISHLDLRGLDLVVLSACQTGLGDIASGEGVFGLQRGFKSAGAKTIVMSLWKVDDNATMNLMVSFYGHYLKGMSKEESFRQAREELRQKSEPGQVRPDWTAFVMLDGE